LVNYGHRELEPEITLCQYMLSELQEIDFQTPPYDLMLRLFREAFDRGEILTASDFLNRLPDDSAHNLQHEAIHLTTPRHEISDGWQKHEIYVPSEDEIKILSDLAYTNILRIKKMLAEERMHSLKHQLSDTTNPEEQDQILIEYMHFKRVDVEIAKLLGTVISG